MTIQERKINAVLEKVLSYEEGIMSRKNWLHLQKRNGATVELTEKPSAAWNRHKYNNMPSRDAQKEYEKKLDRMIPDYRLNLGDKTFYSITKTEFEYFKTI